MKSQCPHTWSGVIDGSELSHRRANRPSAFCSLHKRAEARELQVSVKEGRHDSLPGDSYRTHSGHRR